MSHDLRLERARAHLQPPSGMHRDGVAPFGVPQHRVSLQGGVSR
jgi:hypothetical protein